MLSYQHDESGEWLCLAMQERLLLVKRHDAPDSASRLWDALGSDNGAQAVLDELTSDGLFNAPSFALLTWDGELAADDPATLNVIVRGDITVQIETTDGQETVTGRTISTWAEQTLGHVTGFALSQGAATKGTPSLPLGVGVVRAAQVATAPITTAQSKAAPSKAAQNKNAPSATETVANPAPPTAPVPESPAPVGEETIVSLEPEEPAESGSVESGNGAPEFGATVVRDSDRHVKPGLSPEPNNAVENGPRIDLPTFITGSGPVPATPGAHTPAAAPPPTAPTQTAPTPAPARTPSATAAPSPSAPTHGSQAAAGSGDHDGMTVMSGDIRKLRDSRKLNPAGASGSSAESATGASPAAAPTMYLLLPSGAREPLTQPVLVGRSPSVTKVSGGQVPRLVSLGGADQDISRNHVQFQIEGDTVVVTDLHSRNGTLIVLPGKPPQKLRQGEPTSVIVGTVVDLGSGISLTVCED